MTSKRKYFSECKSEIEESKFDVIEFSRLRIDTEDRGRVLPQYPAD